MDSKRFDLCFDQAIQELYREPGFTIQLPPDSVIRSSWSVVSKRLEQERQQLLYHPYDAKENR